jgi:O-antigen/teichoic acid export membrane protein
VSHQPLPNSTEESNLGPLTLSAFSLVSYAAFFLVNAILARSLSINDFNDYNVGVSTLLLLAALTPLGLEKFSLKILPALTEHEGWPLSRGFLRFSVALVVLMGFVLLLTFDTVLESVLLMRGADYHIAIPTIVGCLPMVALFLLFLEVATAYGAPIAAAALYRIAFPLLLLGLNVAVWYSPWEISGLSSAGCYVTSWLVVTGAMWVLARKIVPTQVRMAEPAYQKVLWLKDSIPLLMFSLLMTLLTQSGVIILQLETTSEHDTSVFAVAMHTGAFVAVLATSTNRFYLPRISVLLDRQDQQGLIRLRRQRLLLMGTLASLFVLAVVLFGRRVLQVFGEDYEQGYAAMCVIAVGTAVSTLFSVAPYALQFAGRHQLVIRSSILAACSGIGLCILLVGSYGALGAALAYAVPMVSLFGFLSYSAWALLRDENQW